jgi:predicted AlkP superfamily phosphohydrolase/phosphomutase
MQDHIMSRLLELRDPETGEQVIEAVYRRQDIYSGDQLDYAPDILFLPRRLEYFGFGEYEFGSHKVIEAMKRGISGTHRMHGVFLAYGAAIRPGVEVQEAQIVDLAPTILYMLGRPIPEYMDGRVLQEIMADDFQPAQPTAPGHYWDEPFNHNQAELTEEEIQILTDRLRDLGYVG